MSENPFESPRPVEQLPVENANYVHDGTGRGYVRQIGVVAWLMMIQGVLMLMFATFSLVFTLFMANLETLMPVQQREQFERDFPPEMQSMLTGVYGVWGVLSVVLAVLYIAAGFRNLRYQSRTFGIVTLFVGLVSIVTCYCAPTGIALAVYGLIIYFHPAAAEAFRLKKTGLSKPQILARFVD